MKKHLVRWIGRALMALSLACTPDFFACHAQAHAGPSVTVQASEPLILPAFSAETILGSRARTLQAAVVFILIGMFMLRKTNYRQ